MAEWTSRRMTALQLRGLEPGTFRLQVETLPCIRVKIKISPESGWADMILLGCEWNSDVHLDRGEMCDFHSNRGEMNSHSDRGENVNLTWIGVILTINRYDLYKKVSYGHVLYVIVFLIGCRGQFMILLQLGVLYSHLIVVYSKTSTTIYQ